MKVKRLFSILFLMVFFQFIIVEAQTYVGPSLGFGLTNVSTDYNANDFELFESGYSVESMVFGVKIDHHLNTYNSLSLLSTIANKDFDTSEGMGTFPLNMSYYYLANELAFNRKFYGNLSASVGSAYNVFFFRPGTSFKNGRFRTDALIAEIGLICGLGYKYNAIGINLNFFQGIMQHKWEKTLLETFDPSSYFYISINYMFKILEKKEPRSRVDCPKL